jgi:hypothetical protein
METATGAAAEAPNRLKIPTIERLASNADDRGSDGVFDGGGSDPLTTKVNGTSRGSLRG